MLFQTDLTVNRVAKHVETHTPIELLMKKIPLLIAIGFLISLDIVASDQRSCHRIESDIKNQPELIQYLENADFKFTAQVETDAVRGVLSAKYYSCDHDQGYLVVKFHDDELLVYKGVPLKTWFEFKFANSSDLYYKEEIKYNFVTT